jgi:4-alpha-glucanotransferase
VPVGKKASEGTWISGPGTDFVDAIKSQVPELNIIAEDLGMLTDDVVDLLRYSDYPGMKVLQFAFESGADNAYLPHKYIQNSVVYTGTHDNNTSKGWVSESSDNVIEYACSYFGEHNKSHLPSELVRAVLASVSDKAVIPIQDWLGLGSDARINTPSIVGRKNWSWRLSKDALTETLSNEIYKMTELYGRISR